MKRERERARQQTYINFIFFLQVPKCGCNPQ
jgi:hypothetical protein